MERDQLEDQSVDRKILLKWIFKKCVGYGLDLVHDRNGWREVYGNEIPRSIKCGEFLN